MKAWMKCIVVLVLLFAGVQVYERRSEKPQELWCLQGEWDYHYGKELDGYIWHVVIPPKVLLRNSSEQEVVTAASVAIDNNMYKARELAGDSLYWRVQPFYGDGEIGPHNEGTISTAPNRQLRPGERWLRFIPLTLHPGIVGKGDDVVRIQIYLGWSKKDTECFTLETKIAAK